MDRMESQEERFSNGRGQTLAARLETPVGYRPDEDVPHALFAHCFTCSKDVAAASRISRALARTGYAVLRFDFTGLGNSDGDFANENFTSNVADLVAAASHLRARRVAPVLLVGHSLGGAAVLSAAGEIPEVKAVATIGAPAEPAHVKRLLGGALETIQREGSAPVELAGRRFRISRAFLEDLESQTLARRVHELGRALLVMHAPRDEVVGLGNARALYEAARHPKSFVSLDGADHLLSRREDGEYAARVLAAWASRYAPVAAAEDDPADQQVVGQTLEHGEVRVEEQQRSLRQKVQAGRHAWWADEPTDAGGSDAGPTPYDQLLGGLGSCTAMTLRLYANHKGWPLESVSVTLRHAKIHARDCADCATKEGRIDRIDRIERVIELSGPLNDEQRARLLEIAERCPVHRTLKGEIDIPTRLAD